jgi:Inner membrane component of T3SS, cytoplasmic domain
MVQLKILSGKKAGAVSVVRHFPFQLGRSAKSDVQLDEDGVWDEHFQIHLDSDQHFMLETQPEALVTINGQPAQQAILRSGDSIEIGSLKMQFWLSQPLQTGLTIRELFVWAAIAAVFAAQIVLIYWLPK